jgi:hypothetical protein
VPVAINKGFQITTSVSGKQRRKKGRIRTNISGFYSLSGKTKNIECTIVDLGMGGLTIQSGVALYQGEKVTASFRLEEDPLQIEGVIGRTSGKNAVLRYEDLPEDIAKKIQGYINKIYYNES